MTTETPPTWAIEEALKRAGMNRALVDGVVNCPHSFPQTVAHATTLAKYEQPPVDPVALLLADYYEGIDCISSAVDVRENNPDWNREITSLRNALEKNGMLK